MFGPAPQHGGTQQGTCCFYKHSARIFGSRPKNLSLFGFTPYLPPCIRTGGETRITQRLQISPWP